MPRPPGGQQGNNSGRVKEADVASLPVCATEEKKRHKIKAKLYMYKYLFKEITVIFILNSIYKCKIHLG